MFFFFFWKVCERVGFFRRIWGGVVGKFFDEGLFYRFFGSFGKFLLRLV